MKKFIIPSLLLAIFTPSLFGATVTYQFTNLGTAVTKADGSTPLTSGTPNTENGNGAIMQLGYFDGGTISDGVGWIAIAGLSSTNDGIDIRVGDSGDPASTATHSAVPDGLFSFAFEFDDQDPAKSLGLSSLDATTQLAVRFYDSTSSISGTNYNTVTHTSWKFQPFPSSGSTTPVGIDLDAGSLVWQDNANAFATTLTAVPEPSSFALLGLGATALLFRRRK